MNRSLVGADGLLVSRRGRPLAEACQGPAGRPEEGRAQEVTPIVPCHEITSPGWVSGKSGSVVEAFRWFPGRDRDRWRPRNDPMPPSAGIAVYPRFMQACNAPARGATKASHFRAGRDDAAPLTPPPLRGTQRPRRPVG